MAKQARTMQLLEPDKPIPVKASVQALSVAPSGRDLVLAGGSGLTIVDLDNPKDAHLVLPVAPLGPTNICAVDWSRLSAELVVSSAGTTALVWDIGRSTPGRPVFSSLNGHRRAITDVALSPRHPSRLATCDVEGVTMLWDTRAGQTGQYSNWHSTTTSVRWSYQVDHYLASSHGNTLQVWDERRLSAPVNTIRAHERRITGIDWNKSHGEHLLTSSSDGTIKLWNWARRSDPVGDAIGNPLDRTLRTHCPVKQAQYTPFGQGIIAIPTALHGGVFLYDRRTRSFADRDAQKTPVNVFGPQDVLVEFFAWRSRGAIVDGQDSRDWQLVSWSSDQCLRLHNIDSSVTEKVGHEKGNDLEGSISKPKSAMRYDSFCAQKSGNGDLKVVDEHKGIWRSDKKRLVSGRRMHTLVRHGEDSRGRMLKETGSDRALSDTVSAIVDKEKVKSRAAFLEELAGVKEQLGQAAQLTEVDVDKRRLTVMVQGPWGVDGEKTGVKVDMKLTESAEQSPARPSFDVSNNWHLQQESLVPLQRGIEEIVAACGESGKRASGVVVRFVVGGDSALQGVLRDADKGTPHFRITTPDLPNVSIRGGTGLEEDEDDEDAVIGAFIRNSDPDLLRSNQGGGQAKPANFPAPRTSGAVWSPTGLLVRFQTSFKEEIDGEAVQEEDKDFRGLARLIYTSCTDKTDHDAAETHSSRSSDSSDSVPDLIYHDEDMVIDNPSFSWRKGTPKWHAKSSDHIYEEDELSPLPARLRPLRTEHWRDPLAYKSFDRKTHSRPSLGLDDDKPISHVSIEAIPNAVPARQYLAAEYILHGDPYDASIHNMEVCKRHGHEDLARAWQTVSCITQPVVPLKKAYDADGSFFTTATRNLVQIARRNGDGSHAGTDLQFDNRPEVADPIARGAVQWGNHPLGKPIVKMLLAEFEKKADVQMLAMLTAVLSNPSTTPYRQQETPPQQYGGVADDSDDSSDEEAEFAAAVLAQSKHTAGKMRGGITVTYKNLDKFDAGRDEEATRLLDPAQRAQQCQWREQYGDQLYSWGMHDARAQVLKPNGLAVDGGDFSEVCMTAEREGAGWPLCVWCGEVIRGQAMMCARCLHAAHAGCVGTMVAEAGEGETLCASGEGCICTLVPLA